MSTTEEITRTLGFPPNTGSKEHERTITSSALNTAQVRQWLQLQGIPYKAAKSALAASAASAYVNKRYLQSWRRRINPQWDLLNADSDSDGDDFGLSSALETPPTQPAPKPTVPDTANAMSAEWLKTLYSQIELTTKKLVEDRFASTTLKLDDGAKEAIKTLAREAAERKIEEVAKPQVIEIHEVSTGSFVSLGLQHERFSTLLKATQARDHRGFRLNIWLTGPTGSGKTSAAESVAKALSLPFGSDGSLDADYKVLGFRDANGHVISTQFLDIYEKGGIYVADEIDNWLPSALLSLNAALANGWVSSPRGLIQRHPDCCVIACANTWGLGATSDYVGRTRLDAASLDRFHPKIDWPVDEKLEHAIADQSGGAQGVEWHGHVLQLRHAVAQQGLKVIISPRATFNGIALLKAGFTMSEALELTIGAGISLEQKRAIGLISLIARLDLEEANRNIAPVFGADIDANVRKLVLADRPIDAMKLYRDHYACDLSTAKQAVDNIRAENAA